ncbi:conserved hypothetical protein [Lodderomyces elongisporus NRRL YB-4239]|uniref:Complex 1 LYR protein domain-containing protein n=1 Tax=Lodderomyces elongisporus (strain ATCC 11503 / CBS 2605 / JCM 1781 / NBRC 1676 / NRRL YB-4239) TaxID=379508 RepID=A5E416_LODEL|nr:conserved hypothetical protein [Lodderomyces elongisporus NRRL YB-4239]
MARRLSGLQRDVLSLYKQCMKVTYTKPRATQHHWRNYLREEFHKYLHLPKKQFSTIEHLLRTGNRKLEMFLNPQIKDIH